MKPFDLEAAKAGAKVCTVLGKDVEILKFDCANPTYPIVALVDTGDGLMSAKMYGIDGCYIAEDESDIDLRMVSVTHREVRYFNIYHDDSIYMHETEAEAMNTISKGVAVIAKPVVFEWEE